MLFDMGGMMPTPRLTVKKSPCQTGLKPGFSWGQSAGVGDSLLLGIWGCAAQQGLIVVVRTLEQGILLALNARTGYHFFLVALKINGNSRFSIQVHVSKLQIILSLFWVNRCHLQMNFQENTRTGSIFSDYLTLGLRRLLMTDFE